MANLVVTLDGQAYDIDLAAVSPADDRYTVTVDGQTFDLVLPDTNSPIGEMEWVIIDGRPYEFVLDPAMQWIRAYDGLHTLEITDKNERTARPRSGDGRIKAPIPGLVARVLVQIGDVVSAGQPLLVLEAMKMENEIRTPFEGKVSAVPVKPGETVIRGQVLAEVQ